MPDWASTGGSGVIAGPACVAAARAPVWSTPTSSASVATPFFLAQSASGSCPTNCPFTKHRSGFFGSSLASSVRPISTTRPLAEAGGGGLGRWSRRTTTSAATTATTKTTIPPPMVSASLRSRG